MTQIEIIAEMGRVRERDRSTMTGRDGQSYPRYLSGHRDAQAYRAQVPEIGLVIVENHGPIRGLLIHTSENADRVNQHFSPSGETRQVEIELATKRTEREFGRAFGAVGGPAILANKRLGANICDTTPLPRNEWPKLPPEDDDDMVVVWIAHWPRPPNFTP